MPADGTAKDRIDSLRAGLAARFRVIAVEGPIGVGKTTLAARGAELLGLEAVLDSSLSNPFLERYYRHGGRYVLPTQLWFLLNRRRLWSKVEEKAEAGLVLADFVPDRELVFARAVMEDFERSVFSDLFAELFGGFRRPDAVVFLSADADVLMERIASRNVAFEGRITRRYLDLLSDAFHNHFLSVEGLPVLVVNTNDYNIVSDPASVLDIYSQLLRCPAEVQYYTPPSMES